MWQPERGQLQRQGRKPSLGSAPRCSLGPDSVIPSSIEKYKHLSLSRHSFSLMPCHGPASSRKSLMALTK